ncbi:interleukin-23 subunit alpha isoform X2 [Tachyglossus aculeatus]|uniref:interleukin-23 subunit alpha isoform X2 n=1 Tax=Tachyglossus aculeatus TaxID=9261 RepID=UPI0018F64EFA|nr:interleukin-23 subunit alpha isoform X2 [Tachyglossus aculeatus]
MTGLGLLVLALLLQPAENRAVPGGAGLAWGQCQQLAQSINTLAWGIRPLGERMELPREEGEGKADDPTPQIQCGDGCDPDGLGADRELCLRRLREALTFYGHLLGSDLFSGQSQPSPVGQLQSALLDLSRLLQPNSGVPAPAREPSPSWQRPFLQHKVLRSLRSFAAGAARVFSHEAATLGATPA